MISQLSLNIVNRNVSINDALNRNLIVKCPSDSNNKMLSCEFPMLFTDIHYSFIFLFFLKDRLFPIRKDRPSLNFQQSSIPLVLYLVCLLVSIFHPY